MPQCFLKTLTGKTITMEFDDATTIEDAMKAANAADNKPLLTPMRLVFASK